MKKIISLGLLATLIISGAAMAEGFKGDSIYNNGGFNSDTLSISQL